MSNHNFVLNLSYQGLRSQCRWANLSAQGDSATLRERLSEYSVLPKNPRTLVDGNNGVTKKEDRAKAKHNDDAELDDEIEELQVGASSNQRHKKSPADDLMCPITWELPFDPVFAEDGRLYEREAIEKHMSVQRAAARVVTSPITGSPMGDRIFPAPQIRSLIETLIENGSIQGDLMTAWNSKLPPPTRLEALLKRANQGDHEAMYLLGRNFEHGIDCTKDLKKAVSWFHKAYYAGSVKAAFSLGDCYMFGSGVPVNRALGRALLAMDVDEAIWLETLGVKNNKLDALCRLRKFLGFRQRQHMTYLMRWQAHELDFMSDCDAANECAEFLLNSMSDCASANDDEE